MYLTYISSISLYSKWIFIHPLLISEKGVSPFPSETDVFFSSPTSTSDVLLLVFHFLLFSLHGMLSFSFSNFHYMALKYCCRCVCFILPKRIPASGQWNSHMFQLWFHNTKSRMVCMYLALGMVSQMVKNLLSMWETWVWSLGQEDPLEKGNGNPLQCSCLENSYYY